MLLTVGRVARELMACKVFMTQRDTLTSVHEPFGDAFYYGPERLSARYEEDSEARDASGFSQSTYQTILERFEREEASEVRVHSSQRAMPSIILVQGLLSFASSHIIQASCQQHSPRSSSRTLL